MERIRSETLKLFVVQMLVGQLILAQIALVRNGVNQACGFALEIVGNMYDNKKNSRLLGLRILLLARYRNDDFAFASQSSFLTPGNS
jgi:hypothetical protein